MIGGLAPAAAYPTNELVEANSVLFSLEVHSGRGVNATTHAVYLRNDLLRLDVPLLVGMGDHTENGLAGEDTTFLTLVGGLPATAIRTLVGNHDDENLRGGAAAQAAWGFNGLNWTYDCGTHLVIGISPTAHPAPGGSGSDATITFAQATLDFLDAQLAAATKDCWIAAHAPLQLGWGGSTEWQAQPAATIKSLLDARPAATCWIAGHVHLPPTHASGVELFDLGTREIIDMPVPAIAYTNPGDDMADPVLSMLATHRDGGADFRIRDHVRRYYKAWPEGGYVRTLEAS